ncbi:SDR family oxidoreductase [Microbacterium elymi]|uniref:SDR family oxidoreductase n=2 Tax=Microbacterium elymi TaxID=2909587 RepID=A0ABY5NMR9_9MICO|nr:SDR family oxidoreductase [Microbacterium elymi]UUT36478.1 SDR family oxidoreductase [Microbacterium elymi]
MDADRLDASSQTTSGPLGFSASAGGTIVACMDLELKGRVVLVVGATGFIGSAVAARLRTEGATVVAASRHTSDGVVMDARDDVSVRDGLERVLREHGRLDAVVVTAAPAAQTLDPSRSSDPDQVLEAVETKSLAFLRVAGAVLPTMTDAGYGRVVGVSGQNAFTTGSIAGSVRNAALIIAAKNLADQVAGTGVTVNTVSPGIVSTDPDRAVAHGGGQCTPDEIADLIAFLVSPLGGGVSGESIAVGHRMRGTTGL